MKRRASPVCAAYTAEAHVPYDCVEEMDEVITDFAPPPLRSCPQFPFSDLCLLVLCSCHVLVSL